MALHLLTLESLQQLDGGRVAEAFMQAIKRCVLDCKDRPGEDRPRKVTLQAELEPTADDRGDCDGVAIKFQIKDSLPTRESKTYSFGVKNTGGLWFSDESPTNHRQLGFGDVGEDGRVDRGEPG